MQKKFLIDPFPSNTPIVIPVIHSLDTKQITRNINVAINAGVKGVFLINHDFGLDQFLPIIKEIRIRFPRIWLGVNFLAVTGKFAFPILSKLESQSCIIDAYWADNACVLENSDLQLEADEIARARLNSGWGGLYFGGVAFKKQRQISKENFEDLARRAKQFIDVITTSGVATGREVDIAKVHKFRKGAGEHPIALASGITLENIKNYPNVEWFLVATGINFKDDFYNINSSRLGELVKAAKEMRLS